MGPRPPVISFIGRSGSGKTTLIEKLSALFTAGGMRVAVIKHMRHEFDFDSPGKDTYRYREAGAYLSCITNGTSIGITAETGDIDLIEAAPGLFSMADLVIIEGYKLGPFPKIEVIGGSTQSPLWESGEFDVTAIVCDNPVAAGVPRFRRDDIESISAFVMKTLWPGGRPVNP